MSVVIQVDRLSKQYRLGEINAKRLKDDVSRWLAKLRGKPDPLSKIGSNAKGFQRHRGDLIWALKDVSFNVRAGEVLGIIGCNGAGKSTILKILSRVTAPSSGEVRIKGRIASLLEVGTGFNPDLTGRDNIYLNGAILGMTKAEIKRKFDEIVAFSEVEKFIDTPVKRYSSGMYVRLAFAVAAHLEPEILIVDEVLAVGDAAFQKKCLGKMQDVAGHGRTILFVSHNMVAVQSLCQRALMLRQGQVDFDGPTGTAISGYLEHIRQESGPRNWRTPEEAPGSDALRFKRIAVAGEGIDPAAVLAMQHSLRIETEYWVLKPGKRLHVAYHLLNEQGITVLATGAPASVHAVGAYRAAFHLPGGLLNSGAYFLKALVVENENRVVYENDEIASFSLNDTAERQHAYMGREPGVIQPALRWQTERLVAE